VQWATLVALDGRTGRALSDATQRFDPEKLNPALPVTGDYTPCGQGYWGRITGNPEVGPQPAQVQCSTSCLPTIRSKGRRCYQFHAEPMPVPMAKSPSRQSS